jgi:hypothetical protein
MNTPRQPNVRPGMAPSLSQSPTTDSERRAGNSSFVTSFTPRSSPAAVETSRNLASNEAINNLIT